MLTWNQPFNFGTGSTDAWPAWVAAQGALAERLRGTQITGTEKGHLIPLDRSDLVTANVLDVVTRVRAAVGVGTV